MTISKLATYLSAGDVTGLQNALFHDLCPGSYRVAQVLVGHTGSALGSGFVFGCMSSVDMICKYVCVCTHVKQGERPQCEKQESCWD